MESELISRSEVLRMLKGCLLGGDKEYEYVKTHIDSIPTVRDNDAVVKELENQKETYRRIRKNTHCRMTEMDDCESCRADHFLEARLEGLDKAIQIVSGR